MVKNYKERAKAFAKDLLGSVICYNGTKYLITIVEIYPYDEEPDDNGKPISYVNRKDRGDGYKILIGNDKPGTIFVFSSMIHVVGECETSDSTGRCDNALIRGAIKLEDDRLILEDEKMSFNKGKPYTLCCTIFNQKSGINFKSYNKNDTEMQIRKIQGYKISDENIVAKERIGLAKAKDNDLRFCLPRDFLIKD